MPGFEVEVALAEAEPAQNGGDLQVDGVAIAHAEALLQTAVALEQGVVFARGHTRVGQPVLEVVHFRLHVEQRFERVAGLGKDGAARIGEAVLRQIAHGECGRPYHGAAVGLVEAGQHAQQGGLAGAVRPAQADAIPIADMPGDLVEQDALAEALGERRQLNHGAAGRRPSTRAAVLTISAGRLGFTR